MKTIGVVGASGHLGRVVIDALLARGVAPERVVALVRTPAKAADLAERGVVVRASDYDDPESMRAAFAGLAVLHLIPTKMPPAPRVVQLQNAIDAAVHAQVGHVVFSGIVGTGLETNVAINPAFLYVESALRICGRPWTILRNGLYADEIVDWVPDILTMGTIPYPTGDGRCAYVHRDDLARATAAVLDGEGEPWTVYELTGPAALTTAELCDAIARATGARVVGTDATEADYITSCEGSGQPDFITKVLLGLYGAIREGRLGAVTDHIERLTGVAPTGIEELVRAAHGAA